MSLVCREGSGGAHLSHVGGHVRFSANGAQVLRLEREGEEVTVFYRPNSLCIEELSKNPVANALAVTFLLPSEQVPAHP